MGVDSVPAPGELFSQVDAIIPFAFRDWSTSFVVTDRPTCPVQPPFAGDMILAEPQLGSVTLSRPIACPSSCAMRSTMAHNSMLAVLVGKVITYGPPFGASFIEAQPSLAGVPRFMMIVGVVDSWLRLKTKLIGAPPVPCALFHIPAAPSGGTHAADGKLLILITRWAVLCVDEYDSNNKERKHTACNPTTSVRGQREIHREAFLLRRSRSERPGYLRKLLPGLEAFAQFIQRVICATCEFIDYRVFVFFVDGY